MDAHALPNARVERAHHLRTFRGRRAILQELLDANRTRGRFTLVVGGPGAGKSALLAKLSAEMAAPFHFIGSHRDPMRFIPALIAQAREAAGLQTEPLPPRTGPNAKDDLKNELGAAISALARAHGRAVILIDGVDELDEPASILGFLPVRLDEGAEIILSARSDLRLLTTLRTRVDPLHVVTLPPMERADLDGETKLLEADLELLIRETAGIPLLLMPALARAEAEGVIDKDALATTAERLFEGVLLEVTTRGGPEVETFLGAIAVAREPIDLAMISSVLVARHHPSTTAGELTTCRRLLEAASRTLDIGDHGVRLWHASFAEFVRERVLGAPGVRRLHEAFSEVCATVSESSYALRHAVAHLDNAGDPPRARVLAERSSRIAAQLRANLLPELLSDLTLTDSPLVHVVRRHAAFLLAHREDHGRALATTLTFEGARPNEAKGPWLRITHRDAPQRALPMHVLRANLAEVLALTVHEQDEVAVIASASADGVARVFDSLSGKQILSARLSERRALAVAFSPDGARLACGTDDGLFVLDLRARGSAPDPVFHGAAPIWGVAWLTDAAIVAGARDGSLTVLSPSGSVMWRGSVSHPLTSVTTDGKHAILVCGARGGLTILTAPDGFADGLPVAALRVEAAFERPVWGIGTRGDRIAIARHDGNVQLFDRAGGQLLSNYEVPNEELFGIAVHPVEPLIACAGTSGHIHLLSSEGDELRELASWKAHDGWINALAWRGSELWSAGTDAVIRSHPARSHGVDPEEDARAKPNVVAYSPRGDALAVGSFDGTLELRVAEGLAPRLELQAFPRAITAIAFAPRMIGVGSSEGALALFRLHTDPKTHTLDLEWLTALEGHDAEITCVRFLGNGPHQGLFATASRDHRVCVFSAVGRRLVASVVLDSSVASIDESEDGRALEVRFRSGGELWLDLPTLETIALAPRTPALRLVSGNQPAARQLGVATYECAAVDGDGAVLARAPFVFKSCARAPRDRDGCAEWTCVTEDGLVTVVLER